MPGATRFEYIDALRGWAILAVILVHVWIWTGADSDFLNRLSARGAYGVQLFYIISAYTLLLSFNQRQNQKSFSLGQYFTRRFFRVVPLFYLAILLYAPMWQFVPRYWMPDGINSWHFVSSMTFLHGWHPLWVNSIVPGGWSMAVEMTFYCLFPLLCLGITTLRRAMVFVLVSLLAGMVLSHWAYHYYLPVVPQRFSYIVSNFAYIYMPTTQLCVFALGFVLYFLFNNKRYQSLIKQAGGYCLMAAGVLVFVLIYWSPVFLPEFFVFACVFTLLLPGFAGCELPLLVNSLINRIGRLSYSLYLSHFGVIYLLKKYFSDYLMFENKDLSLLVSYFSVVLISLLLSTVSYELIEKPGIALGKRLIKFQ